PPATDFSISRNAGTRSSANGNAGRFHNLRPYLIENPACLFGRMMASRVPLCVGRGVLRSRKRVDKQQKENFMPRSNVKCVRPSMVFARKSGNDRVQRLQ